MSRAVGLFHLVPERPEGRLGSIHHGNTNPGFGGGFRGGRGLNRREQRKLRRTEDSNGSKEAGEQKETKETKRAGGLPTSFGRYRSFHLRSSSWCQLVFLVRAPPEGLDCVVDRGGRNLRGGRSQF